MRTDSGIYQFVFDERRNPSGVPFYSSPAVLALWLGWWCMMGRYSSGEAHATASFDTHKFIQTLQAAGFDQSQAEAVSLAFREATGEAQIATRQDLRELDLRLEAKISDIKFDLVKWIAGMLLAQAGLVAALVKLL